MIGSEILVRNESERVQNYGLCKGVKLPRRGYVANGAIPYSYKGRSEITGIYGWFQLSYLYFSRYIGSCTVVGKHSRGEILLQYGKWPTGLETTSSLFNKPGVAMADLQTPLLLID